MNKRQGNSTKPAQSSAEEKSDLVVDIHVGVLWATALLFVCTGVVKAFDMPGFVQALEGYSLLPSFAILPVAMAIPLLEIGGGVITLWPRTRNWGMAILIMLSLIFSVGIGSALVRGLNVGCGCGLPGALSQISGLHLALTIGIALFLSLTLLWPRIRRA
jgi:hypothetical protein